MAAKKPEQPRARGRGVRRLAIATLAGLGIAAVAVSGGAAEIEEISFPDAVRIGDRKMPLFGMGLLRYRVLFRGYVGALYLPDNASASQTLSDVPKALELYYFWDIKGRFFGEAADELLAKTRPPERVAALRERLDRLHALYVDVEEGDRYRLTYKPGQGTTLAHNGREIGTIPGADFAEIYFGIWLGDDPLSKEFRDQMLDGAE